MKIFFPDVRDPNGGKSYFLHSLYKELEKLGATIVFEGQHDIVFGSVRYPIKSKAKKVLRLDGVYHNTVKPNWREKNRSLKDNAAVASRVICQSNFGWNMVNRFVGVDPEKVRIIGNGADPDAPYVKREKKFEHEFLALAKWRPHKRLKDIIESFLTAEVPNSVLNVIGEPDDEGLLNLYGNRSDVIFHGSIFDRATLYGFMKSADASIHLCWFDCFPNSVVEAVCMGCPVICNNTGGTHEIVRPSGGIVLDLDKEYDYQPTDLYNTPVIDLEKVAVAIRSCAENRPAIKHDHVNIKSVAKQYYEVFKEVMDES